MRLVDHYFARLHAHNRGDSLWWLPLPFLPPNLIVDSSYQGHRSSSGPRRGGSGQRSLPLFADVWLRGRYREERESVLSCFAHSDDNAGDTEGGRGGECTALLKGLRRFTLRRYDWIMLVCERERLPYVVARAHNLVPLDAFVCLIFILRL